MSWDSLEIRVTNPGQNRFTIEEDSWRLKRYKDPRRPREFEINLQRSVPVRQFALVEALDGSDVVFRGIAEKYKVTKKSKTVQCKGIEWLLMHRYAPRYNYAYDNITFGDLFDDNYDSDVPGLIWLANSYVPTAGAYTVNDAAKNIIKLSGYGTSSRIGTADLYMVSELAPTALVSRAALADLQTNDISYYRDAADLYVRYDGPGYANMFWYLNGGLIANNAFDTLIRCDTLPDPSEVLQGGALITDHNQILDLLCNLAESHGYHLRWGDRATYTYADVTADAGEGAADGLYELTEDDIDSMEKSIPGQARVHSLTGRGDACQQFYSAMASLSYTGLWVGDIYDVENGYRDANGILIPYTDDEYNRRLADYKYRIKTPRRLLMKPGDYIKVNFDYEPVEVLPSESIEISSSDQATILELGGRDPDFVDAFEALQSFDAGYYDRYMVEYFGEANATATFKIRDDTHYTCTTASLTFAVPSGALDADLNARVTQDISIDLDNYVKHKLGRWLFIVMKGTDRVAAGRLANHLLGDSITRVDVTDHIVAGTNNVFEYRLYLLGNYSGSHTSCTGHPDASLSVTQRYWKRSFIPS